VLGEKLRQAVDLEHWAAFGMSLERVMALVRQVGSAEDSAPASIVALSGDVHHAYLADVAFPAGSEMRSAVYQATCSPFRNPLDDRERRSIRAAWTKPVALLGRALARAAGVGPPPIRWRMAHDAPYFDNQVCFLELDGRRSRLWLQKTAPGEDDGFSLETVFEQRLA